MMNRRRCREGEGEGEDGTGKKSCGAAVAGLTAAMMMMALKVAVTWLESACRASHFQMTFDGEALPHCHRRMKIAGHRHRCSRMNVRNLGHGHRVASNRLQPLASHPCTT